MKKFENPEFQVETLEVADVITASLCDDDAISGCDTETEIN